MESFTISVPAEVLDDLRSRLARTRFTTPSAPGWDAGTDPAYLLSLVEYWATDFDWRAAEARLNAYPQFIDRGQHFVHVRRDPSRPPVLLAHGWPSSFIEMLPLLDRLDVDVVVPSLPGFLYSELPEGPLTRAAIAEAFHTLMTETLGYERYFAFGGDIGGAASGWLATLHPEEVAGLHVIHGPFPADFDALPITPEEQAFLDADEERDETDAGYSWIMGTRPDTIAAALADSPAGLAAWIIDKYRAWSDCHGDLETRFDRDTLCTILTLYWVTECIGTSFRQYLDWPQNAKRPTITVPVAVTQTCEPPFELFPRSIAERAASDLRQYSAPGRGGHFLAFEEPELVADELGAFMRSVG
jgi:pimeloyl-ACP methyl ester carboxylesterase